MRQHEQPTTCPDCFALALARDTAEDRIVDLGNRCIKAEAERDSLKATFAALSESDGYFALKAEWDEEKAKHLITIKKLAEMWAERDKLASELDECREGWLKRDDTVIQNLIAEKDRLAAMVAAARGLYRHSFNGYKWIRADQVDATLADPVEETFQRLNSFGVPYESRNGRGLIGHDAKGRRHEDLHDCMRYTPLTWDQRRAQRRKQ
jgi:hypothetical protein